MPIAHNYLQWPGEASGTSADSTPYTIAVSQKPRPAHGKRKRSECIRENTMREEATQEDAGQVQDDRPATSESRMELITRLKSEIRPQWLQHGMDPPPQPPKTPTSTAAQGSLLPPLDIDALARTATHQDTAYGSASPIERPRSALHRGDFRQDIAEQDNAWMSTSPTTPWYRPSFDQPRSGPTNLAGRVIADTVQATDALTVQKRARASSYSSLSSSFVFRQPTSPLAMSSHIDELGSQIWASMSRRSPDKSFRRRTFSPTSAWNLRYLDNEGQNPPTLGFGQEETLPSPSHHPKRSLSSFQHAHSFSNSVTTVPRSRRTSFSPDQSPIQHAPLVGRYEESILRGRMSTLPSRPLDFVAQIGVLGKGTSVYYNYANDRPTPVEDGPSPYVGLIDLGTGANPTAHAIPSRPHTTQSSDADPSSTQTDPKRKHRKLKASPASPHYQIPNGSYRIPEKGQLQIIIKTPHKTAVKLFLVPYDLTGMSAGTKTFIRQRSYSAGPIVDMPLSAHGAQPVASISNAEDPRDRPVLRYLIHLHICCPSKGRFYLYKSIRVVFANRVPDGKERLRNEIQVPEPRYTLWKNEEVKQMDPEHSSKVRPGDSTGHKIPLRLSAPDVDVHDPLRSHSASAAVQAPPRQLFSFPRTPLPAILSRTTSAEADNMPRFHPMALDIRPDGSSTVTDLDGEISPRAVISRASTPGVDHTSHSKQLVPFKRIVAAGDQSPNRSPKHGLLALQLRDWAERGRSGTPEGR